MPDGSRPFPSIVFLPTDRYYARHNFEYRYKLVHSRSTFSSSISFVRLFPIKLDAILPMPSPYPPSPPLVVVFSFGKSVISNPQPTLFIPLSHTLLTVCTMLCQTSASLLFHCSRLTYILVASFAFIPWWWHATVATAAIFLRFFHMAKTPPTTTTFDSYTVLPTSSSYTFRVFFLFPEYQRIHTYP